MINSVDALEHSVTPSRVSSAPAANGHCAEETPKTGDTLVQWYTRELRELREKSRAEEATHRRQLNDVERRSQISLEIAKREYTELEQRHNRIVTSLEHQLQYFKLQIAALIQELRNRGFYSNKLREVINELGRKADGSNALSQEGSPEGNSKDTPRSGQDKPDVLVPFPQVIESRRQSQGSTDDEMEDFDDFTLQTSASIDLGRELRAFVRVHDDYLERNGNKLFETEQVCRISIHPHQNLEAFAQSFGTVVNSAHDKGEARDRSPYAGSICDAGQSEHDSSELRVLALPSGGSSSRVSELHMYGVCVGAYKVICRLCGNAFPVDAFSAHLAECASSFISQNQSFKDKLYNCLLPSARPAGSIGTLDKECKALLLHEDAVLSKLKIKVCQHPTPDRKRSHPPSHAHRHANHVHTIDFEYMKSPNDSCHHTIHRNTDSILIFNQVLCTKLPQPALAGISLLEREHLLALSPLQLKQALDLALPPENHDAMGCLNIASYIQALFYIRCLRSSPLVRRFFRIPPEWSIV